ncbi:MAG: glycine zipper domain-containing protein [Phenylobacterium sp.]
MTIAMVSALALATAAPALAQSPYQPTQQYQRDSREYQQQQAAYEANRGDYEAAKRAYDIRRADWERARANYDRRYGYGAYLRTYGAAPVWNDSDWSAYGPAAGRYGRDSAYTANAGCRTNNNSAVTAGIIGALAGAALGSNVAANGRGTEGAVLGAVVGGGIGAAVGHANDKYKCDNRGPYYSYNETIPYREARNFRSGRYNQTYYSRQRCRLAAAPIDSYGQDYRYVRVCPDRSGRYRITG